MMATSVKQNRKSPPFAGGFQYENLPTPKSIRILEILDREGEASASETIRCRMKVIDLDDDPAFAALSYTWGNPITVRQGPEPDIEALLAMDKIDELPFAFSTAPVGPNGQNLVAIDGPTRDLLDLGQGLPREEIDWASSALQTIELNGHNIEVQENLFKFLDAQRSAKDRYPTRKEGEFDDVYDRCQLPIWIDALCINQQDLAERSSQVQLMGRIYKSAQMVIAWMGELDNLAEIAWLSFSKILEFEANYVAGIDSTAAEELRSHVLELEPALLSTVPGMTIAHWISLFSFLQRLWFRRAWIAQEAIFPRNILVVCGTNMISLDLLLTVLSVLERHGLDNELCQLGQSMISGQPCSENGRQLINAVNLALSKNQTRSQTNSSPPSELQVDPRGAFSFVLGYHWIRGRLGLSEDGRPLPYRQPAVGGQSESHQWHIDIAEQKSLSDYRLEKTMMDGIEGFSFVRLPLRLLSVLSIFRDLDASDPRDKIFAFLNIATDEIKIIPDYTARVEVVYEDTGKKLIKKTETLAVLSQVEDPSQRKLTGISGWVPDFSVKLGRQPFDQGGEECKFCATAHEDGFSIPAVIEFNSDHTLGVEGIKIDTVASACDFKSDLFLEAIQLVLQVPPDYPGSPLAWHSISIGGNMRRELHARPVSRIEAFWRTLIADNLTEVEDEYDSVEFWNGLGCGFKNWILVGLLEARALALQYLYQPEEDYWASKMMQDYYCHRMNLWFALYDEKHSISSNDCQSIEEVMEGLIARFSEEEKLSTPSHDGDENTENVADFESGGTSEEDGGDSESFMYEEAHMLGRISSPHLPQASDLLRSFVMMENDEKDKDNGQRGDVISGPYKQGAFRTLSSLGQRQLRNFEKMMSNATRGRRLFRTIQGRLGLGPLSTGNVEGLVDEIWILKGAKVPFILRKVESDRYRLVGEAYVHGVMYGEEAEPFYDEFSTEATEKIRII